MTANNRPLEKIQFPWRIFLRTVLVQVLIVVFALGLAGVGARYFFEREFLDQVTRQLQDFLVSLEKDLPRDGGGALMENWCRVHAKGTVNRLTVIARDGKVLCDSHHDPAAMENHAGRPEVKQAIQEGSGHSARHSATIQEDLLYDAVSTGGGLVLRGAIPLSDLGRTLHFFDRSLVLALLCIATIFGGFTIWSGRTIVVPIARILSKTKRVLSESPSGLSDEESLGGESFGEWSELETTIEQIRRDMVSKSESLRREREELATLMGAISEAILAVSREGIPLFYNTQFALVFGNEENLRRRSIRYWEIFRAPEILDAFQVAISERRSTTGKSILLETSGGSERFFSLSVSPLQKDNGEIYGAVGVFHDVTELKAAEQIRIDFVANVSHELRTPLTSIKGYTETLIQDIETGRPIEKNFLEVIARNVSRLMALIGDLLDLSSLESADFLQKAPVRTEEVSSRVLQQLRPGFEAKKQSVETAFVATAVFGDVKRIEQVLINLLDNAHKYTPAGGKIRLSWENEGRDVLLRISDNGPGIPPEHHSRLFERFYRVDKARSREQGGTGLGLAIVKHIMQKHGGTVSLESAVGQGSTFTCRFPG